MAKTVASRLADGFDPGAAAPGRRSVWLALLVAASVVFSLGLACATPLVAFAAIAALTLPRRPAFLLVVAVWLANQLTGYAVLGYPWTANSFAWGAVIGIAAVLALAGARWAVRQPIAADPARAAVAAFVAAFAIDQAVLFAATAFLGGIEDSSWAVIGEVGVINLAALLGLAALHRLGTAFGLAAPAPTAALSR